METEESNFHHNQGHNLRLQRAFDRQLDWCEKSADAVTEFLHFNTAIILALKNDRPDLLKELVDNTMPPLKEFQRTLNKSLLYSDRRLYLRLKDTGKSLQQLADKTTRDLAAGTSTDAYEGYVRVLEQTLFELAKPLRKMLKLDPLSLADFEK